MRRNNKVARTRQRNHEVDKEVRRINSAHRPDPRRATDPQPPDQEGEMNGC